MRKAVLALCDKIDAFLEWGGTPKDVTLLAISAAALILSLAGVRIAGIDPAWIATVLCGIPIILEALVGLITRFDIKADVLVSMALIASLVIGEDFAAGEVAFIMQLGALLEDLTVARARAGIEKLVKLTPVKARVLTAEGEKLIPASDVQVGDVLRVLPGESVPVDGVIISGNTSIDQSVMTGESLPVDKQAGDGVLSGTVNRFGAFDMRAEKVGADSSIQRMVRLVQSADAGKAKIVGLADKWATWVVVIALTAAILTWAITGMPIRAVTILVVFCPCALVLATPTAIMAAIGNATKHGFLVKEGDALERLASVRKLAFDKTGTLTFGTPEVTEAVSFDGTDVYSLAARAEKQSEHPLGKAIVRGYKKVNGTDPADPEEFGMVPGRGVKAVIDGSTVLAGSAVMLREAGTALTDAQLSRAEAFLRKGCTVIWISVDGAPTGFIALSDTLRPTAKEVPAQLKKAGVTAVLLTGDNESAASAIAAQAGIEEYKAACMPEDKLKYIEESEKSGARVCMTGDGVNDAPALKAATVGIAMGGIGSDIAVEAADIALVNDDISELPHLIGLSRHMMTKIKWNLTFSMTLNFIAIILAMTGILNPVWGALVHNCGSVFVIVNSAFLLGWKARD